MRSETSWRLAQYLGYLRCALEDHHLMAYFCHANCSRETANATADDSYVERIDPHCEELRLETKLQCDHWWSRAPSGFRIQEHRGRDIHEWVLPEADLDKLVPRRNLPRAPNSPRAPRGGDVLGLRVYRLLDRVLA